LKRSQKEKGMGIKMKKGICIAGIFLAMGLGLMGCQAKNTSSGLSKVNPDDYILLGEYKGVEIQVDTAGVTDENVEDMIQRELRAESKERIEITDRPIERGDIVNITFTGAMNEEPIEGGSSAAGGYDLEVGYTSFAGFPISAGEELIGHEVGETFDLNLTFPESYIMKPEYAGKDVVFTITVNSIKKPVLPEFNDQFVQSISDKYKTAEEYRQGIKTNLQASKEDSIRNEILVGSWNAVVENCTVNSLPEELVKTNYEKMYESVALYAAGSNVDTKEYIETYLQKTEEEFQKEAEEFARQNTIESLIVSSISEKENLKLTDEEMKEAVSSYTKQLGYQSEDEFKENTNMESFHEYILTNKVKNFVADNAKVIQ
jgi:trigger factor